MLFICSDVGNNWRSHYIHAYYDKHNQIHMERISPDKGTLRPNDDWMTEFVMMLQPNRWFSIRLTLICMWIYTSFSFLSRVAEGLNESWETKHWGIKCISQYIVSSSLLKIKYLHIGLPPIFLKVQAAFHSFEAFPLWIILILTSLSWPQFEVKPYMFKFIRKTVLISQTRFGQAISNVAILSRPEVGVACTTLVGITSVRTAIWPWCHLTLSRINMLIVSRGFILILCS